MTMLEVPLLEQDYLRLQRAATLAGKSMHVLVYEWIDRLAPRLEPSDLKQDPLYTIEGFDGDAPSDLSSRIDDVLYGGATPQ